jgi:hypothetical protein
MSARVIKKISKDNYFQSHWRPFLAMTYIIIILFDFVVGPIMWSLLQTYSNVAIMTPWTSLTLESGGLLHVSLGSVLGIAAFTRGKEKITRLEHDFVQDQGEEMPL